eukprot:TRINITY_DN21784_c0_g1_i1.p1 TRINITY_DN21784_c0_g1~~TRINITY_DN21784_c0_g1_i1.p1  ORF type:complete len:466 (-),score=54.75 TRINITY_DN21784_c0_g1_i1:10-1407(-)
MSSTASCWSAFFRGKRRKTAPLCETDELNWARLDGYWSERCCGGVVVTYRSLNVLAKLGPILGRFDAVGDKNTGRKDFVAAQLRDRLERLGPVFVKVGQALAGKPRNSSHSSGAEVRNTDDLQWPRPASPPADIASAYRVINEDLKCPAAEIFEIPLGQEGPVAVTPFAQIFKWRLEGADVAVKVQRERLREKLALDLLTMRSLFELLSPVTATVSAASATGTSAAAVCRLRKNTKLGHTGTGDACGNCGCGTGLVAFQKSFARARCIAPAASCGQPTQQHFGSFDAWARAVWAELDYRREGKDQEQFCRDVSRVEGVEVPHVCWRATTSRIITTTWVSGVRIADDPSSDWTAACKRNVNGASHVSTTVPRSLVSGGVVASPASQPAGLILCAVLEATSRPPFAVAWSPASSIASSSASSVVDDDDHHGEFDAERAEVIRSVGNSNDTASQPAVIVANVECGQMD